MNETIKPEDSISDPTVNALWQQHGSSMPLAQWVNNEVVKAKTSGAYKQGMTFKQIFDANRKGGKSDTSTKSVSGKKFLIAGMNGYYVIGGALALAGIIYLAVKHYKSKS